MKATRLIFCLFIFTLLLTGVSYADIPRIINYQGKLTDPSGKPVSDGSYSITFRIYEQEAGGSPLWYETQSITTQKGIFSTQIGATKDLNLPFDKPYYLGIQVGSDAEMAPRCALSSSAYAFEAKHAAEASHSVVSDLLTDATRMLPTGVILPWAGTEANVPQGWLLCNGQAVSRTAYANLFTTIGVTFGAGNGSTTFNLPDFRNRFPFGAGDKANIGNKKDRTLLGTGDNIEIHLIHGNAAEGGQSYGQTRSDVMAPYLAVAFIIKT